MFWASWCRPCWSELQELTRRAGELKAAGVDVLLLSVDGLGDERGEPDAAKRVCAQLEVQFPTGNASSEFVQLATGYNNEVVALKKQLPVPTSLLIDQTGRLAYIYKGRLDVNAMLKDAAVNPQKLSDRTLLAAHLPGRMIDDDPVDDLPDPRSRRAPVRRG